MRTGRLETPADLLTLGPDLRPVRLDWLWVGLRAKDTGDVPAATGLRSPGQVEVRAWWDERLLAGRYLQAGSRLLYLDSVRDVVGLRSELTMTATELVGEPATYTAPGGAAVACRVFLAHGVSRPGNFVGKSEYTTQLEAALIEVGRPQPGGVFQVGSVAWRVDGLVEDDDDRITRRMWVRRV